MAINPAARASENQRLGCVLLDVDLKTVTSGWQLVAVQSILGSRLDRRTFGQWNTAQFVFPCFG
jgi:hypothetical protein